MYDLLEGIRALEVAVLAPDGLGMHLGDLGAEVIKVEMPPHGDHARLMGSFRGGPAMSHLQWNKNKKSLSLDLHKAEGRDLFLDLAKHSDAVLDGLRAGAMDRFGLGYEAVSKMNPRIVYCSLNGTGQNGPYRDLGTHGVAFDAMTGIAPVAHRDNGQPYVGRHMAVGTTAGPVYAALGVAAALVKAQRSGRGTYLEVAEMDAAAFWRGGELAGRVNGAARAERSHEDRVRYQYYDTKDGKYILFQPYEWKFWEKFCRLMGREDLLALSTPPPNGNPNHLDDARGNEPLRSAVAEIMKTRTQREWVQFLLDENIPGAPVNDVDGLLEDPHFQARGNMTSTELPGIGQVTLPTTPVKVPGQTYELRPAPTPGQHTEEVLRAVLQLDAGKIAGLRQRKIVG